MIVSKCPLRISLVGGSTDLEAFISKFGRGAVISFPAKLYTYITINKNKGNKYRINYTKTETKENPKDIKNDIAREVINYFNLPPITMIFNSDIDSTGTGLASSSSYMIAAIKASLEFLNKDWSQYEICSLALELERNFNPLTGYQDPYGCGLGGIKRLDFFGGTNIVIKYLNSKIFEGLYMSLIPTNNRRNSTSILSSIEPDKCLGALEDVDVLDMNRNPSAFCNVLNTSWEKKKSFSDLVMNKKVLEVANRLENDNNILAKKLLGAGGGGYFLIVSKKPYTISESIPIEIDNLGVRII